MMKLLRPQTVPPPQPIERRHRPRTAGGRFGYQSYRPCLRWDFGFTCPFCLLHEADLVEHGVEGSGMTSVEHFVPVSHDATGTNDYMNCYYSCRFCNASRADTPLVDARGRRLLDPCTDAWGDHFVVQGDRLEARTAEGAYTSEVYSLDDERKASMRRTRREHMGEWLRLLDVGPGLVEALLSRCAEEGVSANTADLLAAAEMLQRLLQSAFRDIQRFAVIPPDADTSCRCQQTDQLQLPEVLVSQVITVPVGGEAGD